MLKKIVILLVLVSAFLHSPAQNNNNNSDSAYREMRKMMREIIDELNYIRVPNQDFENTLNSQVASAVNEKFKFLYWLVGVLAFIFGSTIVFIARNYLKQSAEITIKEKIKTEIDSVKSEFEKKSENLKSEVDSKLKEVREQLEHASLQLSEAKKEILLIRLEKIKNEVNARTVTEETFRALMSSLKESENQIDRGLTEQIITLLSSASYDLRKETDMEKIVQKSMTDEIIKLTEVVFINLASGFFYNYEATLDETDRNKCILYINESLKKLPNYGEAYGLKLELLMVDYKFEMDLQKKEKIKNETAKMLTRILESDDFTSYETIQRFNRVQSNKIEALYIKLLDELFPEDMEKIRNLSDKYETGKLPENDQ